MIKKPLALLLCTLLLTACDNTQTSQVDESAATVESSKTSNTSPSPSPELTKEGIRRDIKEYIESLPLSEEQRAAAKFEAKVLQDVLAVDINDEQAIQTSNNNMVDAVSCMNSQFENYEEADNIGISLENQTFDTPERSQIYQNYNEALAELDLVIELPSGNTCKTV